MKIQRAATFFSIALTAFCANATTIPLSLFQLTGLTGGTPAATGVFAADLSGLGLTTISSITITDASFGLGGATGRFSGFDLDAIRLSTTACLNAACAAGAPALNVFDFISGILFSPGAQRPPVDPRLFGTGPAGNTVDNAVARLGLFDGNSTTAIPGADGFVSLGDGGVITFNLTIPVSTAGLWLYIGEVGNNGEVAASSIVVRNTTVPEPGTLALLGLGFAVLGAWRRGGQR